MAGVERQAHKLMQGPLIFGKGDTELTSSGLSRFQLTRTESPEGKTSPEEMLAAAHATCYAMAFSNFLAQAGNAPERLHVTSTVSFEPKEGGGWGVTRSSLEVDGVVPGLDQDGFQQAAEEAEQGCPISNAIRGNLDITVKATLAS